MLFSALPAPTVVNQHSPQNASAPSEIVAQRTTRMQTISSGRVVLGAPVRRQTTVRCRAMAENPSLLKKPELKRPEAPPKRLFEESQPSTAAAQPVAAQPSVTQAAEQTTAGDVTIEYQRQRAKEMRKYFQDKKLEAQVKKGPLFGWTPANEIGNGRWVMFGVFVGLLTEYATGVNFPGQIGLLLSYLGIVDLD